MLTRRSLAAGLLAGVRVPANSTISLGIIGTGRRGRYVGAMFANDPRVRVTAISDIYDDQIEAARAEIAGAKDARVYRDYRELLASPVDAVYIATPVYAHPEHFEAAVRARKHLYCEKPAGADLDGVARVLRASAQVDAGKHTVFGLQRRYAPHYREAARIVSSGQLGPLLYMKSNWVSWGVLAHPFRPNPAWDREERRVRYWPHFKETSGDFIVEQDCHGVDVLNWFAGAHPVSAVGSGGAGRRQYGDNSDWFHITYTYPKGLTGLLVGTQLCQNRFGDVKEQFMGLEGTLETHLKYYRWTKSPSEVVKVDAEYDVTSDAVRDFVDKVAEGRPENATRLGIESTITAFLGRMAAEQRREVTWAEVAQQIGLGHS